MKRIVNITLYSLTALAVTTTAAYAEQATTVPTLEGGVSASLGAMYVVPSAANDDYATSAEFFMDGVAGSVFNVDPDYEFGLLASLGYVFDDTANSVELFYRGLFDSSATSSASVSTEADDCILPKLRVSSSKFDTAKSKLEYEHHSVDLIFSQFMNLGEHVQVRFSAGASYVDLEQKQTSDFGQASEDIIQKQETLNLISKSDYSGFGPRVGIDARYDFGQGFGLLAGGSAAYYLGDLDTKVNYSGLESVTCNGLVEFSGNVKNNKSDHGVTNLRGNVAVDYVYFLDNAQRSTIGIELGFMADWYDDIVGEIEGVLDEDFTDTDYDTYSVSFTGPYLLVKGAF